MTHDYERHGTTTLFAAMNVLDGTVTAATCSAIAIRSTPQCHEKQVPLERRSTPRRQYAAHKHPMSPMARTPSAMDAPSPRHRLLAQRRRGLSQPSQSAGSSAAPRSVADLQAAINRFLEEHNQLSKAFTWTADPDKIIAAVRRGHQVLIRSTRYRANSPAWSASTPRAGRSGPRQPGQQAAVPSRTRDCA